MVDDENDEVADGDECNDGGVFEGVEAAEEGEWDDNQPIYILVPVAHSEDCRREAYMNTVIQKWRSTKNGVSSALLLMPRTTPGIKSPIMMRYEIPTPKHLMAIAASKKTAADGYVIFERAKKEEVPGSRYLAQRDCR